MNEVTGRRPVGHVTGPPTTDGIYAAEIYWGWKLLEWRDGGWWHEHCIGRWTASEPLQWIGPFPPLKGKPPAQYDL